ncbi:MAG: glycosyltransferase family 2 protein [Candidatus Aenigmatarchaeota archaeon]
MKLSVVIVNWNSEEFLIPCLESVFKKNPYFDFEIILVDNASTDNSIYLVKEKFSQVNIIENRENIGFTRANNQGIRLSKGEYILLLNPDTVIVDDNIFKKWIDFMDRTPDAGASGCKLIYPDGTHQVGDAGYRPSLKTIINFSFFLSFISPKFKGLFVNYKHLDGPIEVDWICGADFLIRRSIIDKVGLMNEDIFMYADDIEWGCRIRSYGYKVYYLPHMKIIHLQGGSAKKRDDVEQFSFQWLKNIRLLYSLYNKNQSLFLYDFFISAGFILRALLYYIQYFLTRKDNKRIKARNMFMYFKFSILSMIG